MVFYYYKDKSRACQVRESPCHCKPFAIPRAQDKLCEATVWSFNPTERLLRHSVPRNDRGSVGISSSPPPSNDRKVTVGNDGQFTFIGKNYGWSTLGSTQAGFTFSAEPITSTRRTNLTFFPAIWLRSTSYKSSFPSLATVIAGK